MRADSALHIEATQIVTVLPNQSTQNPPQPESGRIYLQASHTLYPHRQPRFIVVENRLIRMDNLSDENFTPSKAGRNAQLPPCMIEITGENRWFRCADIVAQGTPEQN